jgi:hypothetical protein
MQLPRGGWAGATVCISDETDLGCSCVLAAAFRRAAFAVRQAAQHVLLIVPCDASYQPSIDAASKSKSLLAALLPGAGAIDATFNGRIQFFDPGGNWSGVACPHCGECVDGWADAMLDAAEESFGNLDVTAP